MTKMKSKKMTKSTFAIIIMAVAMVAMLAFGGTYAYFTATANGLAETTFTTASIKLSSDMNYDETALETLTAKKYLPGDYIFGADQAPVTVELDNASDVDTIAFVKFSAVSKIGDAAKELVVKNATTSEAFIVDFDASTWTEVEDEDGNVIGYGIKLAKTATTNAASFSYSIQLNEEIRQNMNQDDTFESNVYDAEDDEFETPINVMGATIVVEIKIASIQDTAEYDIDETTMNAAFAPVA